MIARQLQVLQLSCILLSSFPSDTTLTCSNVLAALSTVEEKRLGSVLEVPPTKRRELKEHSEDDYRKRLITHYLQSSPCASWEDIGGQLLYWEEASALDAVKQFLQPEEGRTKRF